MESWSQNPEFRINHENLLLYIHTVQSLYNAMFGVSRNEPCYKPINFY